MLDYKGDRTRQMAVEQSLKEQSGNNKQNETQARQRQNRPMLRCAVASQSGD